MQLTVHLNPMIKNKHPFTDTVNFARLGAAGLFISALLMMVLYFQTVLLDQEAVDQNNARLTHTLNDWTEQTVKATERVDIEASKRSLPFLTNDEMETSALDWVALIGADGAVSSIGKLPETWDAAGYLGGAGFARALDALQNQNGKPLSGTLEHDGHYFLAAVTDVTMPMGIGSDSAPVYIVGGKNLDAQALASLAASAGVQSLAFSSNPQDDFDGRIPLAGPFGTTASLAWTAELNGALVRKIAFPWLLMVCFAFVALTAWLVPRFRLMSDNLNVMHETAITDQLTGLANRTALTEALQTVAAKDARSTGHFAVISLDLDGFKRLNDQYGHQAGDTALRIAATRISSSMRKEDMVFRMGGDEFICLVFDPNPRDASNVIVSRLKKAFDVPMDIGANILKVIPSIGVAIAEPGETWETLLERSDRAMYDAKRNCAGSHFASKKPKLSVV